MPSRRLPAPVLFHGIIEHKHSYTTVTLHAIVWDTPRGHLVYLTPVYGEHGTGGANPDVIATAAAELIRPHFGRRPSWCSRSPAASAPT